MMTQASVAIMDSTVAGGRRVDRGKRYRSCQICLKDLGFDAKSTY